METIPLGLCQCGCGQATSVATKTDTKAGIRIGDPLRFIRGHRPMKSLLERFWVNVQKSDGCWNWTGATTQGYGRLMGAGGRYVRAHRLSWVIANGPIPDGLEVCHNCPSGDNPRCVRPDHLFLGTQVDNMRDRDEKGRQPRGERQGHSKLTEVQVREIIAAPRTAQARAIFASEFGVKERTILAVQRGENWRHVQGGVG